MKIYSLVGKSGAGKSFQAITLANENGIEAIIDDGLFIYKGRIAAGISAKRRETKTRAIKTALFLDDDICREVRRVIKKEKPQSILIIGTSDKMVFRIADRLKLPQPAVRVDINDITTEAEREQAYKKRYELGGHIIPAPTVQIKKDFSGYFVHPLKSLRDFSEDVWKGIDPFTERDIRRPFAERTVVRPTYSYLGAFSVSDHAIKDIVRITAAGFPEVASVEHAFVRVRTEGVIIEAALIMNYGFAAPEAARRLQAGIAERIDEMTSMNILAIDIEIKGLLWLN
ncbi:MAG: Asp23/Gls24 family envelope stress response protein [Clostridiales Family XIII bacterium]|jgi:uncharacterized alkaline shock family protein YloU|nr:Asp23/Gls24 family envelope stress response protein [Clostridiales Family XIII bacterium]